MQKLLQGLQHYQTKIFGTQRELFERLSQGQSPDVLFITCSDSHINPNLLTQTEPGELFILRNAGNLVPPYGAVQGGEAATIEFAVAGLGVKDIIVCGHTHCGAMKGLLEPPVSRDFPALTQWLSHAESTRRIVWNIYNGKIDKGESIRVFPLSNWTELDIWQYIHLENIPIVPLYFAKQRPVVEKDGMLIMVDDERMPIGPNDKVEMKMVRFRTLGCYPLTDAVESTATTLPEIIQEMLLTTTSERQGRLIDHDQAGSMEQKKREGYF